MWWFVFCLRVIVHVNLPIWVRYRMQTDFKTTEWIGTIHLVQKKKKRFCFPSSQESCLPCFALLLLVDYSTCFCWNHWVQIRWSSGKGSKSLLGGREKARLELKCAMDNSETRWCTHWWFDNCLYILWGIEARKAI